MDAIECIESRRSKRGFKPDKLPVELVEKLLKVASNSPSYTNTQPWEVFVVIGEKKDRLSKILLDLAISKKAPSHDFPTPKSWPELLDERSKENYRKRFEFIGIGPDEKEKQAQVNLGNHKFFGAPCAIFICMDESLGPWSILDIGMFAQSILLAAHAHGLGAVPQASVVGQPDAIREFLGLPPSKKVMLCISLGYPDEKAPINRYKSSRADLNAFVKFCA